ncbi:hypothetical protein C8F01DRAFT_1326037 [Mycena amicta]|nr:hypothetical protein C8F01DRAFT_1326037 [Mycena amicta]
MCSQPLTHPQCRQSITPPDSLTHGVLMNFAKTINKATPTPFGRPCMKMGTLCSNSEMEPQDGPGDFRGISSAFLSFFRHWLTSSHLNLVLNFGSCVGYPPAATREKKKLTGTCEVTAAYICAHCKIITLSDSNDLVPSDIFELSSVILEASLGTEAGGYGVRASAALGRSSMDLWNDFAPDQAVYRDLLAFFPIGASFLSDAAPDVDACEKIDGPDDLCLFPTVYSPGFEPDCV